jgi:hypothetical protein
VEVVSVRLITRTLILLGLTPAYCSSVNAKQVDFSLECPRGNEATDDTSAYYGFGEIEIIKLDWGIQDLRIADFNGDGKDDLVTVIYDRIIIDQQD